MPQSPAGELPTQALEALPDPILIVSGSAPEDLAGRRVVFANAAARERLKIPRDDGLLISAIRDPGVLEAIDEALFGRVSRTIDLLSIGALERHWRAYAAPLPAPDGSDDAFALLRLRDHTESVRMERMRVDFLANASHELRTPLASLSGFIETLKGHAREDPVARDRFLDIMSAQTERMGRLVADLLSLSRIELNEHIPPSGRTDLARAVRDVRDALELLSKEAGVRLDIDAPGVAMVTGDRDELTQVAQNLIDNGVKYSSRGGHVDIQVRADLPLEAAVEPAFPGAPRFPLLTPDRDDAVRYARLSVRDHGPGMARESLPRLTERFYRVEGQKSGERSGTGLGLAIVKHIVNRHRGGLIVESLPDQGAAFTVYLPLIEAAPRPTLIEDERRNRTVTLPS